MKVCLNKLFKTRGRKSGWPKVAPNRQCGSRIYPWTEYPENLLKTNADPSLRSEFVTLFNFQLFWSSSSLFSASARASFQKSHNLSG
jgi:hypothetical protein